jgi:hypothetical protein
VSEPRVRFIEHRGKRMLLLDFAGAVDTTDSLGHIAAAKAFVATHDPHSLLVVTDITGSHFNREIVDAMVDLVRSNTRYVKAGAVVGLTGLTRLFYVTVSMVSGRKVPAFSTLDAAKDYLAGQD